jgi:hypothetical protein
MVIVWLSPDFAQPISHAGIIPGIMDYPPDLFI